MIYTVTINPALDYVVRGENINSGSVNRVDGGVLQAGGKGINVSVVLAELGCKSKALGFTAGFTGTELERMISGKGVEADFVRLRSGFTRINVKLKNSTEKGGIVETELNAAGPAISEEDIEKLLEKLSEIQDGDVIVLSGSTAGLKDIYGRVLDTLSGKSIKSVIDTTGSLLLDSLKYRPWLIKPNLDELAELFGERPDSTEKIVELAERLRKMGAGNVLVSMASDGAILVDENGGISFMPALKGRAVNSVGAGDSMLAGFIAGMLQSSDYRYALKLGTAAGAATAFSEGLGTKDKIGELLRQITV